MHDVITIGSATLDVFLRSENSEIEHVDGEKRLTFPVGSKNDVADALFETGGGATNTATTFARQGLNVGIISKIGKDFPGSKVLSRLQEEGITTDCLVQDENDTTDFSTIIWSPGEGSVILVNRGKGKLETDEVNWDTIETKWFYLSSVEGNISIIEKITNRNASIAWNPGKREIEQKETLLNLLPAIELLIVNRVEARMLFEDTDVIEPLLETAKQTVKNKLLITDGHNGSYFWNGSDWKHAGIFEVDRQEATGAGDAFGSAFVSGLIKGYSEEDCLKLAAANAASVVTSPSAKKGILSEEQAKEWIGKELEIKIL